MSGFRSFTPAQVAEAQANGKTIYELATANAGEDDYLIADAGETREDILRDVLSHFELDELPKGWSLEIVEYEIDA